MIRKIICSYVIMSYFSCYYVSMSENMFLCYYVLFFVLICLKSETEVLTDFVGKNLRFRERKGWFLVKIEGVFKKGICFLS